MFRQSPVYTRACRTFLLSSSEGLNLCGVIVGLGLRGPQEGMPRVGFLN